MSQLVIRMPGEAIGTICDHRIRTKVAQHREDFIRNHPGAGGY
jgi:hypothetical protein